MSKSLMMCLTILGIIAFGVCPAWGDYSLTVNNGSGSGTYAEDTSVNTEADSPSSGTAFDQWIGDTSPIGDTQDPNTYVIMPASDVEITATYGVIYVLTVNSGNGSGTYIHNDQANITADAAPSGTQFDAWVGDTAYVDDLEDSSAMLTMPASNAEVTATYTDKEWHLTVHSGFGDGYYTQGTEDILIIADSPPSGTEFDEWIGYTGGIADVEASYTTITMPAGDAEITATYTDATMYSLTVNNGSGSGTYWADAEINIVADDPSYGQAFIQWTGDNSCISNVYSSNAWLIMPPEPVEVTATFGTGYELTVNSGYSGYDYSDGGGSYPTGYVVPIVAWTAPWRLVFEEWTGDTSGIDNVDVGCTTLTMPSTNAEITATYTDITLDPWGIEQQLLPTDQVGAEAGRAVAIDGYWAIVGSPFDFDDSQGDTVGSVAFYKWNSGLEAWELWQKFYGVLDQTGGNTGFGWSAAIEGDIAAVGAPWHNNDATAEIDTGAVYVYRLQQDGEWACEQRLRTYSTYLFKHPCFGWSVDVSDDGGKERIIVGQSHWDPDKEGRMVIYEYVAPSWVPKHFDNGYIIYPDNQYRDWFGYSVAIDGDVAVVGSPGPNYASDWGYIRIYRYDSIDDRWFLDAMDIFMETNTGTGSFDFGMSVDVDGDTIMASDRQHDTVYVFSYDSVDWGLKQVMEKKHLVVAYKEDLKFGHSLHIDGNNAVIGLGPDSAGESWNGVALLVHYDQSTETWYQGRVLEAGYASGDNSFGASVCIDGDRAIVGAPHECGDKNVGWDNWTGCAFVFEKDTAQLAGDLDKDGFVGQTDLDIILGTWGQTLSFPSDNWRPDPSGDGFVGQNDLDIVLGTWGQGTLPSCGGSGTPPEEQTIELASVDNSSALTGYVTQDVKLYTSDDDWLSTQLILTVGSGDIYQDPVGSNVPPNPALFTASPSLEFDTYVDAGEGYGSPPSTGSPVDLYGGECTQVFSDETLQISWYTSTGGQTGTRTIARITLDDAASGTWELVATESPGGGNRVLVEGTISNGVMELDQSSAPGTPDLKTSYDTGISGTDNITYYDNSSGTYALQFDVSGTADGATVRIYYDESVIGTGTGDGDTITITCDGSTDLPDGSRGVTATQQEAGKDESDESSTLTITVDTAAPSVPDAPDLQAGSDSGKYDDDEITNDDTPTFDVSGFGTYYRFYRDTTQISDDYETGSAYTPDDQPDGTYDFSLSAVDAAGNESDTGTPLEVAIDTVAGSTPGKTMYLTSGSDTGASSSDRITKDDTPTFWMDAPSWVDFNIYRDETKIDSYANFEQGAYTAPEQPDGTYDFAAACVDLAGNEWPKGGACEVTIDTVAPTVTVDTNSTSDTTPELTGDVNDNDATIDVTVDGNEYEATNNEDGTWTLPDNTITPALGTGTYDVSVAATDVAGNEGTDSTSNELTITE